MPPMPNLEVTLKYKSIIKSNGIRDEVSEVLVKPSDVKGGGFGSEQLYVTVRFVDSKIKHLNLFVKTHTSNPSHSEMIEGVNAFEKEIFTKYLPVAKQFCKSKGQEGLLDFYPKCYYGDENMVVFENLVLDKGYSLSNMEEKQDMEAVRFALTNLAKHHAISYAAIKESGGPGPFFTRFPLFDENAQSTPTFQKTFAPMVENVVKANLLILEAHDVQGREAAIGKFKSTVGRAYDMLIEPLINKSDTVVEERLFVLNHGDYWNNNMMFRKDPLTNKILGHIPVDFQITCYGSMALDIGYYMFTTVKPNVRRAHWREILEMYLATFKETVEKLSHPVDLSYEELLLIVRKKLNYGFWIGTGLCSEAGLAAFKNINLNELGDMGNLSIELEKEIHKWIDANPQKVKENAEELVKLMDEYSELLIQ